VHDVEPHVAGAGSPHDGVEIGPVVVQEGAHLVHGGGDALDLLLEQTEGVRIGQHEPGDVLIDEPLQRG
jgi:hypothetical protein